MSMSMAIGMSQPQVVNVCPVSRLYINTTRSRSSSTLATASPTRDFVSIQQKLKCNGKFFCLFSSSSNNRKQEDARKALEGALGGKQNEFDKWDQEIKKRELLAAGGSSGGGGRGWFGWGRWFGSDDHFWQEAQQTTLAVLAMLLIYLVVAKGQVMLAVFFNPLLFALRGTRNGFTSLVSRIHTAPPTTTPAHVQNDTYTLPATAKDRVVKKWASD